VRATSLLLVALPLVSLSCGGGKPKGAATPEESGESGFVTGESKCLGIATAPRERQRNEPETIVVKHILVKFAGAKKAGPDIKRSRGDACLRAEEARHRLENGESFGAIVSEYSDESGAASREGLLGPIKRKDVVAPFADAAFELKANEVSHVVETESGFHVIMRTE
jgi:peptidyl-prolyl cis-trans isomerase NIMA-interacting 1